MIKSMAVRLSIYIKDQSITQLMMSHLIIQQLLSPTIQAKVSHAMEENTFVAYLMKTTGI